MRLQQLHSLLSHGPCLGIRSPRCRCGFCCSAYEEQQYLVSDPKVTFK